MNCSEVTVFTYTCHQGCYSDQGFPWHAQDYGTEKLQQHRCEKLNEIKIYCLTIVQVNILRVIEGCWNTGSVITCSLVKMRRRF